jgi:hypothetical protein
VKFKHKKKVKTLYPISSLFSIPIEFDPTCGNKDEFIT